MDNQLVLVTGAAGFIGSELVRQVAERGFRVRAVDNLVNGKGGNLDGVIGNTVELTVADIRDEASMASLIQGVDVIFHLACLGVRHSIHSPIENHAVNASATLGLLKIARAAGVKRFVYVSSSEVYGTALRVPIREDHPTLATTVYGASKLAGEAYTRAFWETYRYPTVVVRSFDCYGPRCNHEGDGSEVISKFMLHCIAGRPMQIVGDGTQSRDFTFVSDTAAGILAAGLSPDCCGHTINLGSGQEVQIRELASAVVQILGKDHADVTHLESRPAEVMRLLADNSKARTMLGFAPTVSLKDGLSRLHDWYRNQEKTAEELLEQEVVRNWESQDVA